MQTYIQPGETLTLTAPAGGVVSGLGYKIGNLFVVACATVAATLPFEAKVTGVFELVKTAPEVWTEGMLIYWDEAAAAATFLAPGNLLIGVAAEDELSAAVLANVRLNAVARPMFFCSAETAGTGAPQNIAHGLGVVPSIVFAAPTDLNVATIGAYTVVEGAHDATNIIVTVTTDKLFKVMAWA